jgi:YebC/PmpR family DNA-binding regulatory protein
MKEIISSVRQGGADIKSNHKLRTAIQKAKDVNMPNENIDRNVKKAASSEGQDFSEITYELYGYGGVGILADVMTDNKNRISSDIHIATNKFGGTVATPGAVSYNFDRKGVFRLSKEAIAEDELFLLVSDAGAEDLTVEDDGYVVIAPMEAFAKLKEILAAKGLKCDEAELAMVPKTWVEVSDEDANANIALIEYLEGLDDVDAVFHNMKV